VNGCNDGRVRQSLSIRQIEHLESDGRVRKLYDWLIEDQREDGGWNCSAVGENEGSPIRGEECWEVQEIEPLAKVTRLVGLPEAARSLPVQLIRGPADATRSSIELPERRGRPCCGQGDLQARSGGPRDGSRRVAAQLCSHRIRAAPAIVCPFFSIHLFEARL
jgi:hypothetical protein